MPVEGLNGLAKKVKSESQRGVKLYSDKPQEAIARLKDVLGDAEKLKTFRKRDETVAICKLNLAAAQIGTGDIQLERKGKETLEEMRKEGHTDSLLLASISFHLGLVSPRPESFLYKKLIQARTELISLLEKLSKAETDDTTTQADDNDRSNQRASQERQIQDVLKSLRSFNETQLGHLSDAVEYLSKCTTSGEKLDVLVMKERIYEKRIQIWDKDLEWLKGFQRKRDHEYLRTEVEDIQTKKLPDMEAVEDVYGNLYGLLTKPHDRLDERANDVLHKHVSTLLRLANMYARYGGSRARNKAKDCADKCYRKFEKNWAAVDMSLCNDLGIIYSQVKDFDSARQCFLMLQNCKSNGPADKSYVFQNLGSVMVLKEKYEDAIPYFKDALHILEGIPNQSERRAHLYVNLGFAFSQMGRGRIWKAFEGYYNAAKCASETAECRDMQPDCASYDFASCRGIYESWAKVHCNKRCGFCGTPPPRTPPPVCKDHLPNCNEFQNDTCTNDFYKSWAEKNCRQYCGFCDGTTTTPLPTPTPKCQDFLTTCSQFQKDTCTNPNYKKWAETNCRKFCGFCNSGVPTTPSRSLVG